MAFPQVPSDVGGVSASDTTSHVVSKPADLAPGEMWLVALGVDGNVAITFPAGWTEIHDEVGDGNACRLAIAHRVADGTEGASITVTTSVAQQAGWHAFRITGHHDSTPPAISTGVVGTSASRHPERRRELMARHHP